MNVLTKAFVVVVTILAVAFVALVVPFAAQVPNYAQQYKDLKNERDAALAKASADLAKERQEMADKSLDDKKLLAEKTALEQDLEKARGIISSLQLNIANYAQTQESLSAALNVANLTIDANGKKIQSFNDVIQGQIKTIADLKNKNDEVVTTLLTTTAEKRRVEASYTAIAERLKAMRQQQEEQQTKIEALTEALAAYTDKAPEGPIFPNTPIDGSVVSVDKASDDLMFVEINVGSRDKVQKGMEFTVYRGDKFLGKIEISNVDTAQSVGKLTLGGGIENGDKVRFGKR